MVQKGKFIVIEGIDGAGISTQTALLKLWLNNNEPNFGKTFFTKEPTEGPAGIQLRLALTKRLKPLDEKVMALLFAADRLDHLYCSDELEQSGGLVSKLDKGINVVSDRYYLSTFAYQSLHVDLNWLREINKYALKPDLTILLNVNAGASAKRRNTSRFHEELYEKDDILQKIGLNFADIAHELQREGENIVILDGTQEKEKIAEKIKEEVTALFTS